MSYTLEYPIVRVFSLTEAYEVLCVRTDVNGTKKILGTVGPYLTIEEAKADLPNINPHNLQKKDIKFV